MIRNGRAKAEWHRRVWHAQAVEIGKLAFTLVAATGDMDVANKVLDFLNKTDQELSKEVEED